MDDDKLAKDIDRASQADGLKNSPIMAEAFDRLEAAYIKAWRESNVRDSLAREKLFVAINLVGKVKDHLQSVIDNGKLSQAELTRLIKNRK